MQQFVIVDQLCFLLLCDFFGDILSQDSCALVDIVNVMYHHFVRQDELVQFVTKEVEPVSQDSLAPAIDLINMLVI